MDVVVDNETVSKNIAKGVKKVKAQNHTNKDSGYTYRPFQIIWGKQETDSSEEEKKE